jgi:hypothetical protein
MARQHGLRLRLGDRSFVIHYREGALLRHLSTGMAIETDWTRGKALTSLGAKGLARRCLDLEATRGRPVYVSTSLGMLVAVIYQNRLRRLRWIRRQRLAKVAALAKSSLAKKGS